jgi:hypothetical protein
VVPLAAVILLVGSLVTAALWRDYRKAAIAVLVATAVVVLGAIAFIVDLILHPIGF